MSRTVKVDIWSDIACPWCFIGKRRFEAGAAEFTAGGGTVEVEFHSYELVPDATIDFDGKELDFLVSYKGMTEGQVRQMLQQMTEVAAGDGLAYDFDSLQHTNTRKAHELLHFAKSKGKQVELKERLLAAYFVEGRHVGHIDGLADLAAEVGLDRNEVVEALKSEEFLPAVNADKEQAIAYGINGVPFFVIDGRFGVSGAQAPPVFADVLRKAVAGS
ncbi:DsbA family oxidoreductase [Rhodococcus fascians]|nr:DsbA family oxidoreductase [Rhodococcus fascians]MBY3995245.1 DsbA family oxidoreductase [Rhodococcus fascians]MBY4000435.1 DsbA family oxidoreductase [Rhodococcus fascians]MBY4005463.1 DsbA family oxidoreductase [Rhodococcus fascians]MBY4016296.1 DsbA family oxidoreductase [Rhodococcus fascians]